MRNFTDIELLKNFKSHENEILEEIYKRYSHLVYGVCLKYLDSKDESLDTVVEIFELLIDKIPKHTIYNFKSWLYSVTKNHCLMKLRKLKREQEALAEHYIINQNSNDLESFELEMLYSEKVENALEQLSNEQRICIELFYYQNKSYTEIFEETGFEIKSVKSYLQNGRIKLKKLIEEQL